MPERIALFGVGSDGSVAQWDGEDAPAGILLRWFLPQDLSFPDDGFDLCRARVDDAHPVPFDDLHVADMQGATDYDFLGAVHFAAELPMQFQPASAFLHALLVPPGQRITLTFPDPAWYLALRPFSPAGPGALRVRLFTAGAIRDTRVLKATSPAVEWLTRGIEQAELSPEDGAGAAVALVAYRLVHAPLTWTHLAHRCLPVTDALYPCRPTATNSDEDEARSRLPPAVQSEWTSRHAGGFAEMVPTLRALATHAAPPQLTAASADGPVANADGAAALRIATLDPHIARIVGLAYDDPVPLDQSLYAYRLVGRWRSGRIEVRLDSPGVESLAELGVELLAERVRATPTPAGLRVDFGRAGALTMTFPEPLALLALRCPVAPLDVAGATRSDVRWTVTDADEVVLAEGVLDPSEDSLLIDLAGFGDARRLRLTGTAAPRIGPLVLSTLAWATGIVEETGLVPGIAAAEPGPPAAPAWLTVRVQQPDGTAGPIEAHLDWALAAANDGSHQERASIFHQVAASQLTSDPDAPQPAVPAFHPRFLLRDRGLVTVPPEVAAGASPRQLLLDRGAAGGLPEGWRCWWVRGVDLFGRASAPTGPELQRMRDNAAPPPPVLLLAEYVQHDLPTVSAALLGQSALGAQWRAAHPDRSAVVAVWAWTPELQDQCGDVDGWRVHVRRPVAFGPPRQPGDPETSYDGVGWGGAVAELGPVATRIDGNVTGAAAGVTMAFTLSAVVPIDATHASCRTTLELDTGAGALVGSTLVGPSGERFVVVRSGEGPQAMLDVEHGASAPPAGPGWTLESPPGQLITISTDLAPPALPAGAGARRFAGALVAGQARHAVLGVTASASGTTFVCRQGQGTGLPAVGAAVSWYPAWATVVPDTGFGPKASASAPVAYAQVAAVSVRRWATRRLASPPSRPGAIIAADAKAPPTPVLPEIPAGPYCAELATRADWYGVSRYTLSWAAVPGLRYVVYRALGDAVMRLDLAEHTRGGTIRAHAFAHDAWAAEIWNTATRRQLVEADLVALDQAIALPAGAGRGAAIAGAYAALHADTQRIIAAQPYARPAFTALHGEPLPASALPFTDELEGRARAHWFYRVASRSPAGVESELSPPTPPICCPDVVPPAPPTALLALADPAGGKVRLRWLASPEPDVVRYDVYRAETRTAATDVRTMEKIDSMPAAAGVLERVVPAPPGQSYFRIVAEDGAGNRSPPSDLLGARPLRARLDPPVWNAPERGTATVALSWTHPSDQRLSCLVERRPPGGNWRPLTTWLPRGTYRFEDIPPDLTAAWEYRLRARNTAEQAASTLATAVLPAAP